MPSLAGLGAAVGSGLMDAGAGVRREQTRVSGPAASLRTSLCPGVELRTDTQARGV